MKYILIGALCVSLTACGSNVKNDDVTSGQKDRPAVKTIQGVTNQVTGMREVAKAKVNGKEIVAVLHWRNYDPARDGSVKKWYGDMSTPPPKYVVKSLMISVDGRGVIVPQSKTRYLASQWMNDSQSLDMIMSGKNIIIQVMLGDGSETWVATYTIDPHALTLVEHEVVDGELYVNQGIPQ